MVYNGEFKLSEFRVHNAGIHLQNISFSGYFSLDDIEKVFVKQFNPEDPSQFNQAQLKPLPDNVVDQLLNLVDYSVEKLDLHFNADSDP